MFRALVVSCALLLSSACDRALLDHDHFVVPDLNGSLRIPLTATGEDGARYRLTGATFELSGTALLTLATDAGAEPALATPLPAGSYSLFLRPGFRVVRLETDGTEQPVEASLAAANPTHFQLGQVEMATLKLAFRHADETLVFGAAQSIRVTRAP